MTDLHPELPKNKHLIVCRTVAIEEADLLRRLGIDDAEGAGYRLHRKLAKQNPDLTPRDVARAVREVRLTAELWIDAVAARLDRLQLRGPRRRRPRKEKRRSPRLEERRYAMLPPIVIRHVAE